MRAIARFLRNPRWQGSSLKPAALSQRKSAFCKGDCKIRQIFEKRWHEFLLRPGATSGPALGTRSIEHAQKGPSRRAAWKLNASATCGCVGLGGHPRLSAVRGGVCQVPLVQVSAAPAARLFVSGFMNRITCFDFWLYALTQAALIATECNSGRGYVLRRPRRPRTRISASFKTGTFVSAKCVIRAVGLPGTRAGAGALPGLRGDRGFISTGLGPRSAKPQWVIPYEKENHVEDFRRGPFSGSEE